MTVQSEITGGPAADASPRSVQGDPVIDKEKTAGLLAYVDKTVHGLLAHVDEHVTREIDRQFAHLQARVAEAVTMQVHQQVALMNASLAEHFATEIQRHVAHVDQHLGSYLAGEIQRQMAHIDKHLAMRIAALGFAGAASWPPSEQTQKRILSLAALLAPYEAQGFSKVREGGENDGGYVMLDDFSRGGHALSLGIGDEITWDLSMAERGFTVHQFDHTVKGPPIAHPRFRFSPTRIVPYTAGEGCTIATILGTLAHQDGDLILKIDIEGDEWPVMAAIDSDVLSRFSQVVCEFHEFRKVDDDIWFATARTALERLAAAFAVVHVHANNYGPLLSLGNVPFPDILEVTFVNRARYRLAPTDERFPTPLDRPNNPDSPDILLGSFRFDAALS